MHPIERLRYVARAGAADHRVLVEETAEALVGMADDVAGLVMSCRRLIERNPSSGPLWTLCARVLCGGDPAAEADDAVQAMAFDETPRHLVRLLPADARVTVVGWPEVAAEALGRRGDLDVLVVDARGEGLALARRLARADVSATEVDESSAARAARSSDVVLVEAHAFGGGGLVATVGSDAVAAVARHAGVPVWAVVGACRALPDRTWKSVVQRLDAASGQRPWNAEHDIVSLDLVDVVVGPEGRSSVADAVHRVDGPFAPELSR